MLNLWACQPPAPAPRTQELSQQITVISSRQLAGEETERGRPGPADPFPLGTQIGQHGCMLPADFVAGHPSSARPLAPPRHPLCPGGKVAVLKVSKDSAREAGRGIKGEAGCPLSPQLSPGPVLPPSPHSPVTLKPPRATKSL